MEKTRFTRGPWIALPEEVDKNYIRIRGTNIGGRYKIANVMTPVYENVHEREAVETRANARLIASAPDLLDALQCLFENYKQLADSGDAGNWRLEDEPAGKKALHAINKALGKE
ncbi:hypothetical protein [Enterobacter hormaechei]|uniref:hypothetical protein n=1 Tax=Enterobacter hormaechei TaxID=158836 RepID=UPI001F1AAF02|nr:hypothetical protein [Enterobacter hormaechei]